MVPPAVLPAAVLLMLPAALLLSASGYLIIAQPQSGSTAVAFSLGLAMLPRMCTYQDRDRHGHRVGRDKRNATALDPDFDWTAGSQETDLGNFELRELRNWLASDCVQKQHVVPTPTNVARVRTLGPTFAQRGALLLRDPRASALSLFAKYHMANATDRLRRRLAYLVERRWNLSLGRTASADAPATRGAASPASERASPRSRRGRAYRSKPAVGHRARA